MIGFDASHDGLLAAIIVAAISSTTSVIVTTMGRRQASSRHDELDQRVEKIDRNIDTGNGHSLGAAVARLEGQNHEIIDRLDRVEVKATEAKDALDAHIDDVAKDVAAVRRWEREEGEK